MNENGNGTEKKLCRVPLLVTAQDLFAFDKSIQETKEKYKLLEEHYSFCSITVPVQANQFQQPQMQIQTICYWYAVAEMTEEEKKVLIAKQQIIVAGPTAARA